MRRKKVLRALLPVVMAFSILAGCGEPQETMESIAGTRQEESTGAEEAASSEENKGTEDAAQGEENVASGETVQEEEKESVEYDASGNMTRDTAYGAYESGIISWTDYEYEYDISGNAAK